MYGNCFSVSSALHRGFILMRNPANVRNMGRHFTLPHTLLYGREFILVKTHFVCQKCRKLLVNSYQLTVLYGVHSDERPYECKECGKTFGLHGRLTRHQTTHSCKKPFEYYTKQEGFYMHCKPQKHQNIHVVRNPMNAGRRFYNYFLQLLSFQLIERLHSLYF